MSDKDGWGIPGKARKAHYFVDGKSLCGRWQYVWQCHKELPNEDFTCPVCERKLKLKEGTR